MRPPHPVTIIFPFMLGWMAQWYSYVPGVSKTWAQPAPFCRVPESKAPVEEVTVWGGLSLLVHVTVVPLAIVSSAGLKENPLISTEVAGAAAGGEGVEFAAAGLDGAEGAAADGEDGELGVEGAPAAGVGAEGAEGVPAGGE